MIPRADVALVDQFLQTLSLLAGLISFFVIIPVNAFQNISPWVNRAVFSFGCICLLITGAAYSGRYWKGTFVLSLVCVLNVLWFPNGGTSSSVGLYFFIVTLFIVTLLEGTIRLWGLGLVVVDIGALLVLELLYPEYLFRFQSNADRLIDLVTGYVISLSMCALIAWVILTGFNRERSRAQSAIATSLEREKQLRAIFEGASDGIGVAHAGILDLANPTFVSMFGYESREAIVGLPLSLFIESSELDTIMQGLESEERTSVLVSGEVESTGRRRDGTSFPIDIRLSVYELGGQARIVVRVTDLTERKRIEQQQKSFEMQTRRNEKMESMGVLAGGIAHDMNNVLSVVLGLASVHVEEAPAGSALRGDLEAIARACQRGSNMIKGLRAFARDTLPESCSVDLNSIVREVAAFLELDSGSKLRLCLDLDPNLMSLRGDPASLSQALTNLCSNASDAMPNGGVLAIHTSNLDFDTVLLKVEDTGSGMSKEVLDRALEPFFTTKPMGKGTGLGLPVVYGAVKAHQGKLEIHSTPGKGTEVQIRLPVDHSRAATISRDSESSSIPPVRRLKILLVDDDELVQHAVHRILRSMGHTVTTVSGGASAIAVVEAGFSPELVILDMNMPEMDGAATLPRLRQLIPNVSVVLATGRADDAAMALVASFPNVTLLPKPFNAGDLSKRVDSLFRRSGVALH